MDSKHNAGSASDGKRDGKRDGTHPEGGATERMRRAISAASDGTGSRDELKTAARELVEQLRAEHERPEQMLLQIKRILAESGLRPSYSSPRDSSVPVGVDAGVYRDVIAWSIRFYYADGDGSA
jgi:hypothetical protein